MHATVLLAAPFLVASLDGPSDAGAAEFAPPVQLTAGGKNHTGIMYPSPALHDVDGDGARELLIGEIFGTITISDPLEGGPSSAWTKARPMKVGGEPIKLNNW